MGLPKDYIDRVYAGVLGKLIGVYLGRPIEGWSYERITERFGEINYYVHEYLDRPLVVPDDDISGTFTFLRALADHGTERELTSEQIGKTWLNYIVPDRTILWWGGLGRSTEHTAFLRLLQGIPAPRSGSIELNGKVVAEQIGAQIFIDGWAMVAPGDPERAADLAKRAAHVSHDGEAVCAAQLLAAMEAHAFCESRIERLIETGLTVIPKNSVIGRMVREIQEWAAKESDWRAARERLADQYGYHTYSGGCHVVPNHGLIILSLLYGEDDFQKALMIANTSGWDTDCNSGNVGCLMGIKNGLSGIDRGPDWRTPIADRLYLSAADGGRTITDAVRESYRIVNMGRSLLGLDTLSPKGGARFHFEVLGSVQGFQTDENDPAAKGVASLSNVLGNSRAGERCLAIDCRRLGPGRTARVATPTFIPPEVRHDAGYHLMASPTLNPGQVVHLGISADQANTVSLIGNVFLRCYTGDDQLVSVCGPQFSLEPGAYREVSWPVEDTGGRPIAEIGVEFRAPQRTDARVYLDYMTWEGTPTVRLRRPDGDGDMWRRAWVDAVDSWRPSGGFHLAQNSGVGLVMYGTEEWTDYRVRAALSSNLVKAMGLAARVQGMRRYFALTVGDDGKVRLMRMYDQGYDQPSVLAEAKVPWQPGRTYNLWVEVVGNRLRAGERDALLFDIDTPDDSLARDGALGSGGIGLVCEEGSLNCSEVVVESIGS